MIDVDGEIVELTPEDVVIERIPREGLVVASEGDLVVALETELTDDLVREGLARELVSRVQNLRKAAGFEVTQRIRITLHGHEDIVAAVTAFREYIEGETLCVSCETVADPPEGGEPLQLNDRPCVVRVTPA